LDVFIIVILISGVGSFVQRLTDADWRIAGKNAVRRRTW